VVLPEKMSMDYLDFKQTADFRGKKYDKEGVQLYVTLQPKHTKLNPNPKHFSKP
jgi:hypothetical protein